MDEIIGISPLEFVHVLDLVSLSVVLYVFEAVLRCLNARRLFLPDAEL